MKGDYQKQFYPIERKYNNYLIEALESTEDNAGAKIAGAQRTLHRMQVYEKDREPKVDQISTEYGYAKAHYESNSLKADAKNAAIKYVIPESFCRGREDS